jgi:hypothetical protein
VSRGRRSEVGREHVSPALQTQIEFLSLLWRCNCLEINISSIRLTSVAFTRTTGSEMLLRTKSWKA